MSENNISLCQYVDMSECQYVRKLLFSLGMKMEVVQNGIRMLERHYVTMSICQYVNMSICQNATFQLSYQNENCSKCHQEKVVKKFESERE